MSEVEVYAGHMKPGDIIRRYAYAPIDTPTSTGYAGEVVDYAKRVGDIVYVYMISGRKIVFGDTQKLIVERADEVQHG